MNRDHVEALTQVGLEPTQILALSLVDAEQTIAVMLTGVMSCDVLEMLRQARVHITNAVRCLDTLAPRLDHDFETCAGCDQCDEPIAFALPRTTNPIDPASPGWGPAPLSTEKKHPVVTWRRRRDAHGRSGSFRASHRNTRPGGSPMTQRVRVTLRAIACLTRATDRELGERAIRRLEALHVALVAAERTNVEAECSACGRELRRTGPQSCEPCPKHPGDPPRMHFMQVR